jgi:hypothetical protein
MTVQTQTPSTPEFPTQPLRPGELSTAGEPNLSWLWHGFLARTKVTALVGLSKTGKTTLLSVLLARAAQGGQLAGLAVAPARVFVASEEAPADWDARCRQLAIGPNVQFLCRPFQGARPTEAQWFSLVASLNALHRREGLDLVVIDPLARLLPGYAETSAPKLLDCLLPLQALASLGPAVWLVHHPAKGRHADGQAARGTSALTGLADIVLEMGCVRRARSRDRRRRICGYSRYAQTPRHLILELNAEGTDYLVRTDAAGNPLAQTWDAVVYLLENAYNKLTQQEILQSWPVEDHVPDRSTLARWLKRASRQGMICCEGSGYRGDPFLYWLRDREPLLIPGRDASEAEKEAWRQRCQADARALYGWPTPQ